jgi:DNA-binding MarR family transcriptional regulator
MMVTSGNVTGLVDGMVADKLVTRQVHETDRRSIVISLTPAGRKLFASATPALSKWLGEAMAEMNDAEIARLIGLLAKLKHSADKWE